MIRGVLALISLGWVGALGAPSTPPAVAPGAPPETPIGPARGSLLVVGGGSMTKLWPVFFELAGGRHAPIVVIPTASELIEDDAKIIVPLRDAGATHVTVLHTRDRAVANTEKFCAPLRTAKAVWFTGGRQWRLADAYLTTLALREMRGVLDRGGVIGGSSAGATIQGSYLVRGSPEGNQIMIAPGHEEGFGFLRNATIDQHINTRKRADDLRPVLAQHRELLGIGLDEATALIVRGNACEIVGAGTARFFATPDGPVLELVAGRRYDLAARREVRVNAGKP